MVGWVKKAVAYKEEQIEEQRVKMLAQMKLSAWTVLFFLYRCTTPGMGRCKNLFLLLPHPDNWSGILFLPRDWRVFDLFHRISPFPFAGCFAFSPMSRVAVVIFAENLSSIIVVTLFLAYFLHIQYMISPLHHPHLRLLFLSFINQCPLMPHTC